MTEAPDLASWIQGGEQAGERHHGGLRCEGFGPQRPRRADGLAAANLALTDRSCPEPNSPEAGSWSAGLLGSATTGSAQGQALVELPRSLRLWAGTSPAQARPRPSSRPVP